MYLADPTEIRSGLGFDDMTDINAAIAEALNLTEAHLAAKLHTTFEQESITERFYAAEATRFDGVTSFLEMRVSKAIITAPTAILANTVALLADETGLPEDVTLISDLTKGVVTLTSDNVQDFKQKFVEVTYTAGFAADTDNALSYDLDVVPSWLQEAAKLHTLIILETHPVLEETDVNMDTKQLNAALDAILGRHVRYTPLAITPLT